MRRPSIIDRDAGVARGVRRGLGLAGRGYGEARGQVAQAERSAGCRGMRKVRQGEAARRRWWRRKAAAFERGAWAAGGEAGVEASGQGGEACWWRAAWERGLRLVFSRPNF